MDRDGLIEVLAEAREWSARPDNSFAWSSWADTADALNELDGWLEHLRDGGRGVGGIATIFAPTGPLQELALSSGWGETFIELADRFDAAADADRATVTCVVCGEPAGVVEADGDQLRRDTFTGLLVQPLTEAAVKAINAPDPAAALYALDPELTPFYCPQCERSYCSAHWATQQISDGIRGTCPNGHQRMLDD